MGAPGNPGNTGAKLPRYGAPIGNQNARRAKRWRQAIERALERASKDSTDAGLDQAADILVGAALGGDLYALREIGDRIDGKAIQIVGGDEDNPIAVREILIRAVAAGSVDDRITAESGADAISAPMAALQSPVRRS